MGYTYQDDNGDWVTTPDPNMPGGEDADRDAQVHAVALLVPDPNMPGGEDADPCRGPLPDWPELDPFAVEPDLF